MNKAKRTKVLHSVGVVILVAAAIAMVLSVSCIGCKQVQEQKQEQEQNVDQDIQQDQEANQDQEVDVDSTAVAEGGEAKVVVNIPQAPPAPPAPEPVDPWWKDWFLRGCIGFILICLAIGGVDSFGIRSKKG